jgi:hypothetical protein
MKLHIKPLLLRRITPVRDVEQLIFMELPKLATPLFTCKLAP